MIRQRRQNLKVIQAGRGLANPWTGMSDDAVLLALIYWNSLHISDVVSISSNNTYPLGQFHSKHGLPFYNVFFPGIPGQCANLVFLL